MQTGEFWVLRSLVANFLGDVGLSLSLCEPGFLFIRSFLHALTRPPAEGSVRTGQDERQEGVPRTWELGSSFGRVFNSQTGCLQRRDLEEVTQSTLGLLVPCQVGEEPGQGRPFHKDHHPKDEEPQLSE